MKYSGYFIFQQNGNFCSYKKICFFYLRFWKVFWTKNCFETMNQLFLFYTLYIQNQLYTQLFWSWLYLSIIIYILWTHLPENSVNMTTIYYILIRLLQLFLKLEKWDQMILRIIVKIKTCWARLIDWKLLKIPIKNAATYL